MKPSMIAKKPIWECLPIDLGNAYGVAVIYRGKCIAFNTYTMVRRCGVTHEQAVLSWLLTMQTAIDRGWKP